MCENRHDQSPFFKVKLLDFMLKKILLLSLLITSKILVAQTAEELIKLGDELFNQLKEEESFVKYKSAIARSPSNINLLVRATEVCLSVGGRQSDKNAKKRWSELANTYAHQAWNADSNNVQACYIMSAVCGRMTELETDKKKIVAFVKDIKMYADRGLRINPNYGKVNFIEGKWHFQMVTLNWAKRLAVKALYGGLPDGNIDSCIYYFEKCRQQDIYYVYNFLMLAKAYKENNNPTKTIEVLNKLLKLPISCLDDKTYKEEAKKMLEETN